MTDLRRATSINSAQCIDGSRASAPDGTEAATVGLPFKFHAVRQARQQQVVNQADNDVVRNSAFTYE